MASIELRDVSFLHHGRALLEHVDLTVPDGQTLAIVGPPGGGKSLLLAIVMGLQEPTSGDVLIDGEVVTGDSPRRRDLSMVFDDYALHPHLDVRENLAFSSTLRRKHDKAALADAIEGVAEFLALDAVLDDRPESLDEARRQRVATGRALVREARAYLLDDPFSAQSDRLRTHVRSVVLQWQVDHGRTTIMTTSDIGEALSSADQVAVLHQGFVHQIGTPRELYEKPADMFVAGYLGAPAMNLIPGIPGGDGIQTPVGTLAVDDALRQRIAGREVVVVGIRPEHLVEAAAVATGGFSFTSTVDDVEWHGRSQFVYLGYTIDPEVETVLNEVEDLVDFDLFQSFVAAELSSDRTITPGRPLSIAATRDHVHVFDPVTGENLT